MIKRFLQRWPSLYQSTQRAYYGTLYRVEQHLLGTHLHELMWRYRSIDEFKPQSLAHPHRTHLVERLRSRSPFTSILEVGCSAGANLVLLAKAFPRVSLHGVDLNPRAIREARRLIQIGDLPGASVSVGHADDLRTFPDQSVDIVLTDATLMYVGSDKICATLDELVRVGRRAVLVNEWHLFDPLSAAETSRWYDAHWVHDYRRLLARLPRVRSVRIERPSIGMWGPGGWEEYGAFIEAELVC